MEEGGEIAADARPQMVNAVTGNRRQSIRLLGVYKRPHNNLPYI
jgi:hypothetical protein